MKRFALGALAAMILSTSALAGEQYIDSTGFAVSGYDVVAYRNLAQTPVGGAQPAAVPGRADITADYNGARFAFASAENRDRFLANPAYYAPQYDGHCAFGVSKGGKVPGNPNLWRIVDDKLYLNITPVVVGFWEADISGNINKAEGNWPGIEGAAASDRVIPSFQSSAPTGG
ncbi:YHS domain-containing (seleno)protein [Phaeobacter sp. QD34_3]|uniref:YHS domain-containing (seleno)protein n=1 Tax=unclassified Phaeobacter TaxID=2621772 RepID=UPI00237EEFAF|nr:MULTISPECIES: YHS domain-containing (seleno)protein [unclassified Phaeobacter]MDE4133681.1 YHS domain-containing (seleno)protein [Phaeobacter sp. QD34_3]MDE4137386.1 YHS domain-containing (seleno)protein [Phaeobacter sp. QD34_24]MDE4176504.1 YHS domain-containing (seleno)protein [Phaeobacter sp. PT47_59]